MRIAWVIYGGLELVSGGFVYDRCVVERLRASGVEVDVVALPWPGYAGQLVHNLRPIVWPRPPASYAAVVEDQLVHPSVLVHNRRLAEAGARVVALVHNLTAAQPATEVRWLKARVERAYLRGVRAVVAVCESTQTDVARQLGSPVPSVVARAGRDHVSSRFELAAHRARAQQSGPLRVLFLANVLPHKGLQRLLEALARVPSPVAIELDVIGTLDERSSYGRAVRSQARALGLAARIAWRGQLVGAALEQAIAACHVLALPSDREAYPLACLEAMAQGLPVLTTDRGGTAELLVHGREGFLIAPDDCDALARALAALARDRNLLANMGEAAHARWLAHGTWHDTAQVFARLIAGLSGTAPKAQRQ